MLAALAAPLLFYAFRIEPASLRLSRYDVALERAPALRGLTIAVISDLHGGAPFIDEAKIDRVVDITNGAHPDLVLLTGDYVITGMLGGRHMAIENIAAHLQRLHPPLGVYAVIGNHDRWEDAGHIADAFEKAGIPVLENAHRLVQGNGRSFYLAGIGDDYTRAADPARALSGLPPGTGAICFTHSPDIFPALPETCRLTIAGHTHGGQVRLPLLGPPYVPSRYWQRYVAGTIRENGKVLFVSTGIGTSVLPVRLGVPPEVALVQLR